MKGEDYLQIRQPITQQGAAIVINQGYTAAETFNIDKSILLHSIIREKIYHFFLSKMLVP